MQLGYDMKVEIISKGRYRLLEAIEYEGVVVPVGFGWDGASVPILLTPIVPKAYGTMRASCFHDYLCRRATNKLERKFADHIWRSVLKEEGMSGLRSDLGYVGVRIGAALGVGIRYPHWTDKIKEGVRSWLNAR